MHPRDTTEKTSAIQQWVPDGQIQSAWHEGVPASASAFMICAVSLLFALISCAANGGLV